VRVDAVELFALPRLGRPARLQRGLIRF